MDHDPYGLTDRPFQLTPDPRFYFDSATHRKAMTYLGYGLAQGEGFIVVTGEVGTGKTMLVGRLMATIDRSRLTAINLVSTQLEGEDILRIVALSLGVASDGAAKGQLLARIERFLHEQARGGKRTLLIVDEAQNLPMSALEELRMLSNFQFGGQALLQIFLLGQPEFRDALAQPRFEQLRQRVIATHHLTAMSMDETGPYIMHRLACAGWKGAPRFSQAAFEAFHRLSGGIPRRLNMLAARVLLQGAIERLVDIDGEVVEDVAADLASESIMPAEPSAGGQPIPFAFPEATPQPVAAPQPYTAQPFVAPQPFAMPQPAAAPAFAPMPQPPAVEPPLWQAPAPVRPSIDPSPPPASAWTEDRKPSPPPAPEFTRPEVFAVLPEHVPPPSIAQPPRYDGVVPAEAVPPPAAPPIPATHFRPADRGAAVPAEPVPIDDVAARNAELEARLAEQEKILRRTLSLLVEWVESEEPNPHRSDDSQNAA
ncbi:putative secretion ATPase, PEP-CTERM locus subfamily [Sphingomonas sp. YR710]|uniref:XrtA/PEP-CTERM system-associated ATPase n=1 Tax=Sphingomonas sp. YR710 TaxID=1882773 RepID=UPI0008884217|nr:XrtA/PEP-CTERM system-associated ATPase [Sphingomonas sp. YR710]SDD57491.1 putative secretion ATPase, PEP-CTERM locus subfamily [Sphingomonas sp. YR710]